MKKLSIAIVLIALCTYLPWANAKISPDSGRTLLQWHGVVTYVSDGDTLWVRPDSGGESVKIRIDGMDAPEICQAYGPTSRQALESLVLHQAVNVEVRRRDNYGRVLARVSWQRADVGEWMVRQGHGWSYRYRRDAGPYVAQEAQAKAAQRGLFADTLAQQPRDFRKRHGSCHERGATSHWQGHLS